MKRASLSSNTIFTRQPATHDFMMQSRQHEWGRLEEVQKELGVVVIAKVGVVLRVGNARPRDSTTIRASILVWVAGNSFLGTVEMIEMEMAW
jgi:hypothetical protein